jgi:glycosyltransferase involved in cell wall biosynthesis
MAADTELPAGRGPRPPDTPPRLRLVVWTLMPTHHQSAFFRALRDSGIDLKVCYLTAVSPERRALGWPVPESLPPGERYVRQGLRSLGLVREWRDHVHVVGGAIAPFMQALVIVLSAENVPWVHWSERGVARHALGLRAWQRRAYAQLVNRCALGAFAIGQLAEQDFRTWGIDPSRIRFLPYSVDPPAVAAPVPEAGRRGTTFVQVGELSPRKGVDVLLRAFAGVVRRHPAARLVLVGDGPAAAEYRALAATLQLSASVDFLGAVPAAQVGACIQRADVLTLASRFDGWGVVLNEGAALGKALVATDAAGAAAHLIRPGCNGFVVPAEDVDALWLALERYCSEPTLAQAHGAESRRMFEQFTPAANARRLYENLASLGWRA